MYIYTSHMHLYIRVKRAIYESLVHCCEYRGMCQSRAINKSLCMCTVRHTSRWNGSIMSQELYTSRSQKERLCHGSRPSRPHRYEFWHTYERVANYIRVARELYICHLSKTRSCRTHGTQIPWETGTRETTYEWVMAHTRMSHVTHKGVMSHVWVSHGTRMNESWHTDSAGDRDPWHTESDPSGRLLKLIEQVWMRHDSHIRMNHGAHINESDTSGRLLKLIEQVWFVCSLKCAWNVWVMWVMWVMRVMWVMNGLESWHTYEWVMAHTWHTYEGGMAHTYEWTMAHTWMSHGTHMNAPDPSHVTHMSESCHSPKQVVESQIRVCMSHVTHMNESCHTREWDVSLFQTGSQVSNSLMYERATSHIWMSHVTHMNESRHTYESAVSRTWMSHVALSNRWSSIRFAHVWMSHVTRRNESRHTIEWVMSHV